MGTVSLTLHLHDALTFRLHASFTAYLYESRVSCLHVSFHWHSGSNVSTFLPSCEPSLPSGIKLLDIMASTRAFTGPQDQTPLQVNVHRH
jgi:hypothetical protein